MSRKPSWGTKVDCLKDFPAGVASDLIGACIQAQVAVDAARLQAEATLRAGDMTLVAGMAAVGAALVGAGIGFVAARRQIQTTREVHREVLLHTQQLQLEALRVSDQQQKVQPFKSSFSLATVHRRTASVPRPRRRWRRERDHSSSRGGSALRASMSGRPSGPRTSLGHLTRPASDGCVEACASRTGGCRRSCANDLRSALPA